MLLPRALLLLFVTALAGKAHAQEPVSEGIQIGLSTDRVSITADFSGANLTIFGALENVDPLISRQGRYDVVVVLEGPPRTVVVRKKTRVLGMWINTQSVIFRDVPASYSVAMTRQPQDITAPANYRRLALRPENVHLQPLDPEENVSTLKEFRNALRARKEARGLYVEYAGGVQFLSRNLFRATLRLAPNVPVGTHRARAFLFRNGVFVEETSALLTIRKAGLEQRIFEYAHQRSFLYGLAAVLLAIVTGWLGRLIFRKE
ncbi:TIGR02186 family protein [Chelativorans salis]|uniref:TIGR02186 family protein n=1 Tax=Chelativorans salis TaxID=2978478 RepID=A0ABT2LIS1_9HYPH|nr:TIGR02186 family protein [Chelativorans sp. EGI FJ00035]MCT7374485.1 TIGR02186 family protein [Chelativorans sp. EGI FJ00035]